MARQKVYPKRSLPRTIISARIHPSLMRLTALLRRIKTISRPHKRIMQPPPLPNDLLELILDELSSFPHPLAYERSDPHSTSALATLCLVSHVFYSIAHKRLYYAVSLHSTLQVLAFSRTLVARRPLAALVHSLALPIAPALHGRQSPMMDQWVATILSALRPNLRRLAIGMRMFRHPTLDERHYDRASRRALRRAFERLPGLEELVWANAQDLYRLMDTAHLRRLASRSCVTFGPLMLGPNLRLDSLETFIARQPPPADLFASDSETDTAYAGLRRSLESAPRLKRLRTFPDAPELPRGAAVGGARIMCLASLDDARNMPDWGVARCSSDEMMAEALRGTLWEDDGGGT